MKTASVSGMRSRNTAITLIEMLIVICIIAILTGILWTAIFSGKRKATETSCVNNLRQIGLAIQMYRSDYNDQFPPDLEALSGTYVKDKQIFRCPQWQALRQANGKRTQKLTGYLYTPSIFALYAKREKPERDDPPWIAEGWAGAVENRGERLPLVICDKHDPVRLAGQSVVPGGDGTIEWRRNVLRLDGSAQQLAVRRKKSLFWLDL